MWLFFVMITYKKKFTNGHAKAFYFSFSIVLGFLLKISIESTDVENKVINKMRRRKHFACPTKSPRHNTNGKQAMQEWAKVMIRQGDEQNKSIAQMMLSSK